jgi:RHS repeat-associated protein
MHATPPRKTSCAFACLFIALAIAAQVHAADQIVFGPRNCEIGRWHLCVSLHAFRVDTPGDGRLVITKNTPDMNINGGFVCFNNRCISLDAFLAGKDLVFYKDMGLRPVNYLFVFLRGTPGAAVTTAVSRAQGPVPPAPPDVSISAAPASIEPGRTATLSWTTSNAESAHIDNGVGVVPVDGSTLVSPVHTTTYTITVTGTTGSANAQAVVAVMGNPAPQPEGSFGAQYADLVPPDATAGEYDPKRFSIVTGLVHALDGSPVGGVSVTIHDHPGYGTVSTDTEGRFSIPVEGGGTVTVVYRKAGLITAHRKVHVPWNDIAIAETLQMMAEDPAATTLTFDGNPETVVIHQGTAVTDEFGSRACTLVFTRDNSAVLLDEDGNDIQELTTITTRATEFTTPESMPAVLPPNSAYTYCVELSVEGVQRVRFARPVITWVDNFLGFDVGEVVPVGYYDRDRGVWVPSDNGVVVKLLDMDSDGTTDGLDADGDGSADDLNGNGSVSDEVAGLTDSLRYPPGATFWRVEVSHFSPHDLNWPYGPPPDSTRPNPEGGPQVDLQKEEEQDCKGQIASFVEERSRILHEDIPVPGTDMTLHYAGNRVQGYRTVIDVPASGESVPDSLKRIVVRVEVAGRTLEQILDPLPGQTAQFMWDGLDHLGRRVNWAVYAHISVGFVYEAVYLSARKDRERAFAKLGLKRTAVRLREEITSWRNSERLLNLEKGSGLMAEGWTLSAHHHFTPTDPSTLHKGDGMANGHHTCIVDTVAGNGTGGYCGDQGPATEACISVPYGVVVDAGGSVYISDFGNYCVRKVDPDGVITTFAGNCTAGFSGDGGPATEASLDGPTGITLDASGNLYIADYFNHRIRKVDANGIITTVAGNGTGGLSGDEGPATQASLNRPYGVAADAEGNLYIADSWNQCVRKVDASGTITTVAGNGYGYSGDNGPAVEAQFRYPYDVAVDAWGNLYIADKNNHRIRKIDASGIITTVAGSGTSGYKGDGGPAIDAQLSSPYGVAVDAPGNLYIADWQNRCVRKVDTNGNITTWAGIAGGEMLYGGDGGPATEASFNMIMAVAVDAPGNLYIADAGNRIRKVAAPAAFSGAIASGDVSFAEEIGLGYIMAGSGQHKKTIDLDTGAVLYEFGYDTTNALVSITDRFGARTVIERNGSGVPTAIISPDGITTHLTVDEDNFLTRIAYPDGSHYSFEYTPDGLMTAKIEPEGNQYVHEFDANGRLTQVLDEEGGNWQYSRTAHSDGDILSQVLTGEGNLTSYLDHNAGGSYRSSITDPTGAETLFRQSSDGLNVHKSLACGMTLDFLYGVDHQYWFKTVRGMREMSPSGLQKVTLRDKTYADTDSDSIPDRVTETVTVNGKASTFEHDVLQAQKTITSPEGRTVIVRYDPATLLTSQFTIPGLYDTSFGYDSRGRVNAITTHTRETAFTYTAQGFLESITGPEDFTTAFIYDPVGRITAIDRPDGASIGFAYDGNGNMTVLTNPSAISHEFDFNHVNLKSAYQTPLNGSYSYVYDKDRRLSRINLPSGAQIHHVYDKTRLMQIQTPEGTIDFTYVCGSKVGSITKGTDTITYAYDGKLLTSETLSGTLEQTLSYTYSNDFNVQSLTYAGHTQDYTYDKDGLLIGAGDFTILRNAANGLPETLTGNGLNLSRTFNGYGELDEEDFVVSGQGLTSYTVGRDDTGRIIEKAETIEGVTSNFSYTYDPVGRLLTVTWDNTLVEAYAYGPNGTRIQETNVLRGISDRTLAYSDEDHLLSAGDTTYQYDADGHLISRTQGSDVTSYDYSSRGELLSVTRPDGSYIQYVYDPLGRRIAKKVDGVITEKYLWQGLTRLLAVFDGNENLIMRFAYADSRVPVSMEKNGTSYYLSYDPVGSLRLVADASGNAVKRIDYDSFGNIINDTNPSFEIPLGFAGGLHDRDTGLVRFGLRDYAPDIGRWTAKDPILFAGGDTDLYGYCLNNPVNLVDDDGLLLGSALGHISTAWGGATAAGPGALVGGVVGGTIGGAMFGVPGAIIGGSIVGTLGSVFDSPAAGQLNYREDLELKHFLNMKEWEEIDRKINELLEKINDLNNRMGGPIDDSPCQ